MVKKTLLLDIILTIGVSPKDYQSQLCRADQRKLFTEPVFRLLTNINESYLKKYKHGPELKKTKKKKQKYNSPSMKF